ncbi:pseudouridine synthase deg1 [Dispira parvispora]|uniref:Pseudouridine synthase deg1 n=1 Tax=Dispira parvispora TaxID=1520584 RepID=A0A9W8AR07_9FUNG|nr:pseudouridine synthase deg1 [Dispira parvispora]
MATPTSNYQDWTSSALIERIQKLEAQLGQCESNNKSTATATGTPLPASTTPGSGRTRKQRAFDWTKYAKRRIALKVAYFGWDYSGFAAQGEQSDIRTVEGELFTALKKCRLIPDAGQCRYSRCGRTDRGVSGVGQVVALDVRSAIPKDRVHEIMGGITPETIPVQNDREQPVSRSAPHLLRHHWQPATDLGITPIDESPSAAAMSATTDALEAREMPFVVMLNRELPRDIRVLAWAPIPVTFNARYDCLWRHYKYYFSGSAYGPLSISAMRQAAKHFLGSHDFRYFCKIDPAKEIQNYERTVLEIDITPVSSPLSQTTEGQLSGSTGVGPYQLPQFYELNLRGSAFLWHQVRCMTSVLLLVGQGLETPSVVQDLLQVDKARGRPIYPLASEIPLILYDCYYQPKLAWRYSNTLSCQPLHATHRQLLELWNIQSIKALTVGCALETVNSFPVSQVDGDGTLAPAQPLGDVTQEQWPALGIDSSTLINQGGGHLVTTRTYIPIMQRSRTDSVDQRNERYQAKKRQRVDQDSTMMQ